MLGILLGAGKVLHGLGGKELSERGAVGVAVDRRFQSRASAGRRGRAGGRVVGCDGGAPALVEGGAVELQVEAEVVGDGKVGAMVEIGGEIGGYGGLAGGLTEDRRRGGLLLVDPLNRGQAEEGDGWA
jgi:hypothetical protein